MRVTNISLYSELNIFEYHLVKLVVPRILCSLCFYVLFNVIWTLRIIITEKKSNKKFVES